MLRRWRAFGVAAAATFVAGLVWAQQSSVGGQSSRPRFQSLTVTGNADLNTIDSIAVSDFARLSASNVPTSTNAYDLGSSAFKWRAVYANDFADGSVATGQFLGSSGTTAIVTGGSEWTAGSLRTAGAERISYSASTINLQATTVQVNGQPITSGTFTPTATAGTNLDSVTGGAAQYLRVRDVVTLSGVITIDPTAAAGATTIFRITLPVASDLAAAAECAGTGVANHGTFPAVMIFGDITNNACQFNWASGGTASTTLYYTLTYRVI